MDLLALLAQRHADYRGPLGRRWWRLARDAYEGTGGFRSAVEAATVTAQGEGSYTGAGRSADKCSYLVQFPRESESHFARRQEVSSYRNYLAPCARTFQGHLWKRKPQRSTTVAPVQTWWDDTDGEGTSVDEWMQEGSKRAQLDGWAAAIFDRPEGDQPATAATTLARWLDPEELVDWELGPDGTFTWARLWSREETRDPFDGSPIVREVYTTWTPREWWRVELEAKGEKAELKLAGEKSEAHKLGRVPIAVLYWTRPIRRRLYGISPLDGVVNASLELFNVCSEQRDHERSQVFGILCVQSANSDVFAGIKLGSDNGIVVEPTMGFPQFVAPPESLAMHYSLRVAEITARIYEAAGLEQPKGEAQSSASGVAKAYDFKETGAVLAQAVREHERFEYECAGLAALWAGVPEDDTYAATTITYPSDFDLGALAAELETQFGAIAEADKLTPTMVKAARLKVARALSPDATADERKAVEAEIEALFVFEKAAFDARTKRIATPASEAATDAVIADLPEAAPGAVVSTQAAPDDAVTTDGEGE